MKISNTHRMPRLRSSFWEYVGHYTVPWPAGAIWKNKQKQQFSKKNGKNGKIEKKNGKSLKKNVKWKFPTLPECLAYARHSGNMLDITQYHGLLAQFEKTNRNNHLKKKGRKMEKMQKIRLISEKQLKWKFPTLILGICWKLHNIMACWRRLKFDKESSCFEYNVRLTPHKASSEAAGAI